MIPHSTVDKINIYIDENFANYFLKTKAKNKRRKA